MVGKPVRVQFGSEVELPIGWQEVVDAASGKAYYFHAGTNASQWDRPGFIGRVTEYSEDDGKHKVVYTDGGVNWHDLDQMKWSEVTEEEHSLDERREAEQQRQEAEERARLEAERQWQEAERQQQHAERQREKAEESARLEAERQSRRGE